MQEEEKRDHSIKCMELVSAPFSGIEAHLVCQIVSDLADFGECRSLISLGSAMNSLKMLIRHAESMRRPEKQESADNHAEAAMRDEACDEINQGYARHANRMPSVFAK